MLCHASEVEGYSCSAMAHSPGRASQEPEDTVSAHGSRITMRSSPTGYWQHWENGGDSSDYRIALFKGRRRSNAVLNHFFRANEQFHHPD
jgi:hypothetical protein